MYPHRIRLRGPWEWEAGTSGRIAMPCRWSDLGQTGHVSLHRRFGLPRRLDAFERVWLTFAGADGVTAVRLNGQPLDRGAQTGASFEWEITDLLTARNHLQVEVAVQSGDHPIWEEVALEIRCTAYLRGVRVEPVETEAGRCLQATGTVVGTAEQLLEVYLLHAHRTVGYTPVTAGQPFTLISDPLSAGSGDVRVELVCGAVVWYTAACGLALER